MRFRSEENTKWHKMAQSLLKFSGLVKEKEISSSKQSSNACFYIRFVTA